MLAGFTFGCRVQRRHQLRVEPLEHALVGLATVDAGHEAAQVQCHAHQQLARLILAQRITFVLLEIMQK